VSVNKVDLESGGGRRCPVGISQPSLYFLCTSDHENLSYIFSFVLHS
jgi:hypothetical protein